MSNIIKLSDRRRARLATPSCGDAIVVRVPPQPYQEAAAAFWLAVAIAAETTAAVLRGWQAEG